MWAWFLASNDSTEGQIYSRQYIHFNGRYIWKKLHSNSVLGFDSSEEITHFNNYDISDNNMRCADCIKKLWDDMSRKMKILKELHALVKALNRKKSYWFKKIGFFKRFITTFTEYFFSTFGLGTTSFEKRLFYRTERKMSIDTMFWSHVHWFWWVPTLKW